MAKKSIKDWYKSKTVWVAVLQAVAGIVVAFVAEYPEVGGILVLKSSLDILLRVITSEPLK